MGAICSKSSDANVAPEQSVRRTRDTHDRNGHDAREATNPLAVTPTDGGAQPALLLRRGGSHVDIARDIDDDEASVVSADESAANASGIVLAPRVHDHLNAGQQQQQHQQQRRDADVRYATSSNSFGEVRFANAPRASRDASHAELHRVAASPGSSPVTAPLSHHSGLHGLSGPGGALGYGAGSMSPLEDAPRPPTYMAWHPATTTSLSDSSQYAARF